MAGAESAPEGLRALVVSPAAGGDPYVAELYVPDAPGDDYPEALYWHLTAAARRQTDRDHDDEVTLAADAFRILGQHSTVPRSPIVLRRGLVHAVPPIAEFFAERGVGLRTTLGGVALHPGFVDYVLSPETALSEAEFEEYCDTGSLPASRTGQAIDYGGGAVFQPLRLFKPGVAPDGTTPLDDVLTDEYRALIAERRAAERREIDAAVARTVEGWRTPSRADARWWRVL